MTRNIAMAKPEDPLWCTFVLRPLSVPFVLACARVGITPNQVSLAGTGIACVAAILLATGDLELAIAASLIFNFIALLDCVDGALARYSGIAGPAGSWFDAQTGYTVYAVLPLAVAWRASAHSGEGTWFFSSELILMAGALTAILNLYSRVLFQKYLLTVAQLGADVAGTTSSQKRSLKNRVSTELGFVGFMMPALFFCILFEAELFYVLFYFAFYGAVGVGGTLFLIRRLISLGNKS